MGDPLLLLLLVLRSRPEPAPVQARESRRREWACSLPVQRVTIEVLDQWDAAARAVIRPEPTESVGDPDGVLEAWGDYQRTVCELLNAR